MVIRTRTKCNEKDVKQVERNVNFRGRRAFARPHNRALTLRDQAQVKFNQRPEFFHGDALVVAVNIPALLCGCLLYTSPSPRDS